MCIGIKNITWGNCRGFCQGKEVTKWSEGLIIAIKSLDDHLGLGVSFKGKWWKSQSCAKSMALTAPMASTSSEEQTKIKKNIY